MVGEVTSTRGLIAYQARFVSLCFSFGICVTESARLGNVLKTISRCFAFIYKTKMSQVPCEQINRDMLFMTTRKKRVWNFTILRPA